jgi:hypothetical protein
MEGPGWDNGAGPDPVDTPRGAMEGPGNHPIKRRAGARPRAFRCAAGEKAPMFNRNRMIDMEIRCWSLFHQTDMKALKHR